MATKCLYLEFREAEAQAMAIKRQSANYREKEAQVMATKHQSAVFSRRETHAKAIRSSHEYFFLELFRTILLLILSL